MRESFAITVLSASGSRADCRSTDVMYMPSRQCTSCCRLCGGSCAAAACRHIDEDERDSHVTMRHCQFDYDACSQRARLRHAAARRQENSYRRYHARLLILRDYYDGHVITLITYAVTAASAIAERRCCRTLTYAALLVHDTPALQRPPHTLHMKYADTYAAIDDV